ncbi:hypothetical protein NDU88_005124 [Pleurodeles waltl]|uniref:Uncharacterized protein n=1 Tax=Pleurodeles waltl TaxID=8319 RepID=A0AAV7NLL5_PLEWA|nr:hypothetical protein NDU88_005124 [Pleurodeles waltl]
MDKSGGRQAKLQFDSCRSALESGTERPAELRRSSDEPADSVDMKTRLTIHQILTSVESKMAIMWRKMDSIMHKLGKHDGQLQEVEQHLSIVEDTVSSQGDTLLNMKGVLKVIATKKMDLVLSYFRGKIP